MSCKDHPECDNDCPQSWGLPCPETQRKMTEAEMAIWEIQSPNRKKIMANQDADKLLREWWSFKQTAFPRTMVADVEGEDPRITQAKVCRAQAEYFEKEVDLMNRIKAYVEQ